MRWSKDRSLSCEGRRDRRSRKTCGGTTCGNTKKGEIESVKLSNCRIVLDFLRLFRYVACYFSLCILHRADPRIKSQDEIFKEEKARFHFTDLYNKEMSS